MTIEEKLDFRQTIFFTHFIEGSCTGHSLIYFSYQLWFFWIFSNVVYQNVYFKDFRPYDRSVYWSSSNPLHIWPGEGFLSETLSSISENLFERYDWQIICAMQECVKPEISEVVKLLENVWKQQGYFVARNGENKASCWDSYDTLSHME